ncbi:MAG: AbgT family transporter, partial [Sarcina sp.]
YLLLIMVILITTLINPIMTSGSTKWVLLAPMVVPMFSILGISPAYAQLAFRIGDSATNIISPLQPALPVVLGLLYQYQEKDKIDGEEGSGFGSVFSLTLPYSIVILFSLIILLTIWYHLELPIGPGIY